MTPQLRTTQNILTKKQSKRIAKNQSKVHTLTYTDLEIQTNSLSQKKKKTFESSNLLVCAHRIRLSLLFHLDKQKERIICSRLCCFNTFKSALHLQRYFVWFPLMCPWLRFARMQQNDHKSCACRYDHPLSL